jgi:ribosome-associated protein
VDDDSLLRVDDALAIPRAELTYRATRSGGPGGQHVNTSATRVEVAWDVAASPSLDEERRARILRKLANRINAEGVLLLTSSEHRSQHRNREDVTERLAEIVRQALVVPRARRKTRTPRAAREARLQAKKRRAHTKKLRGRIRPDE